MFSDIFHIHNQRLPVHRSYKLEIKPKNLSSDLISKALIVNLDNDEPDPQGGVFKDGYLRASPRQLGSFAIMVDTIAPEIVALNIHQRKKINGYKKITFKVTDDLSGIKSYRGTLNGEWVLVEFDPKNDRLTYFVDERVMKGENTITLKVVDDRDNSSSYKAKFVY